MKYPPTTDITSRFRRLIGRPRRCAGCGHTDGQLVRLGTSWAHEGVCADVVWESQQW